jgi:hypothetical protein
MAMDTAIIKEMRRRWAHAASEHGRMVLGTLDQIEWNLKTADEFRAQIKSDDERDQTNLMVSSATMYETRANTLATLLGVMIN